MIGSQIAVSVPLVVHRIFEPPTLGGNCLHASSVHLFAGTTERARYCRNVLHGDCTFHSLIEEN